MDKFVSIVYIEPKLLKELIWHNTSKKYNAETYQQVFEHPVIDVGFGVSSMNLWLKPMQIMNLSKQMIRQDYSFEHQFNKDPLQVFGTMLERGFTFLTKNFSLYKVIEDMVLSKNQVFFIHTPFYGTYYDKLCDYVRYVNDNQKERNEGIVSTNRVCISTEEPFRKDFWNSYIVASEGEWSKTFSSIQGMVQEYIKRSIFNEK